jgi:hypothetical protein
MWRKRAVAGLLFLACLPSETSAGHYQTITIKQRFSGLICAGYCIDSDLVVRSNGTVLYRVSAADRDKYATYRYHIAKKDIQAFQLLYAQIRPVGVKGPVGDCEPDRHVIDYDIRWDDSHASRLLACSGIEDVRSVYYRGLRALRISSVTGRRLSQQAAEDIR